MNILIYIMIGIIQLAVLDVLANLFEKQGKLRIWQQILVIVLWPIYLIMFIYYMIRSNNEKF